MVADRQKYPGRRLSRFLWIRDLAHQMRYLLECNNGQMTSEAAQLANEACNIYRDEFSTQADAYCADALMFANQAMAALGRGVEYQVSIKARKPEVTGEETVGAEFAGRFDSLPQVLRAIESRLGDVARWDGPYA